MLHLLYSACIRLCSLLLSNFSSSCKMQMHRSTKAMMIITLQIVCIRCVKKKLNEIHVKDGRVYNICIYAAAIQYSTLNKRLQTSDRGRTGTSM